MTLFFYLFIKKIQVFAIKPQHNKLLFFLTGVSFSYFLPLVLQAQPKKENNSFNLENTRVQITSFSKSDFNADPQFWTMYEDHEGVLYFGNNDGVLIYNGVSWHKVVLPNHGSVRSIVADRNGVIYVCGYHEVGTLEKDHFGTYTYVSWIDKLHWQNKDLENIWQAHEINGHLLLRTFHELLVVTSHHVTRLPATSLFTYAALIGTTYYIADTEQGLLALDIKTMKLNLVFTPQDLKQESIVAVLPTQENHEILLFTKSGAIYKANTETKKVTFWLHVFKKDQIDQITSAISYHNQTYLIGTLMAGIVILDRQGHVQHNTLLTSTTKNTSINYLYKTKNNAVWSLHNHGLDYIDFKAPVSILFHEASVYDALFYKHKIYLATNKGIYYADSTVVHKPDVKSFKKLPGLHGQAWSLQVQEQDLVIAHDEGLFVLQEQGIKKIGSQNGFWKMIPLREQQGYYLACHYEGLYLVEKKKDQWIMHHKISGCNESTRDIIPDTEPYVYWVCHGYKGVFKIHLNPNLTKIDAIDHFTNQNGLKSPFNINAFVWRQNLVFTTNTGFYTYNHTQHEFIPYKPLNSLLGTTQNTRKLLEYHDKTWFVLDDQVGYFLTPHTPITPQGTDVPEKDPLEKPQIYTDLFLDQKGTFNRGMECIVPLSNTQVLFGTTRGLYIYNTTAPSTTNSMTTTLSRVSYWHDQEEQALPILNLLTTPAVPTGATNMRFDFAAPQMSSSSHVTYSYWLEPIDAQWSSWQTASYKEYSHLPPGAYTFKVKSRNHFGATTTVYHYPFVLLPKWYKTSWAFGFYGMGTLFFVVLLTKALKQKIARENLKSQHELQQAKKVLELEITQLKLKQEQELMHLDKVTLEEDILIKNKELANYTMLLMKKKEIFSEIQYDLKQLKDLLKNDEPRQKVQEIFQKVNQHKIGEEYMTVFDLHFEKIHHRFFEQLKQQHPNLTKRELRLCAFVKMNLSNKEIAPLLAISVRGVETARYRIRKKLQVQHDDQLSDFLERIP